MRLDNQLVPCRHHAHDRFTSLNDPADRLEFDIDHLAVDRRCNDCPFDHVGARPQLFIYRGELGPHFVLLVRNLVRTLGLLGQDLHLGLANLLLRFHDFSQVLAAFAGYLGIAPLQPEHLGFGHEPAIDEILFRGQFLGDVVDLPGGTFYLHLVSLDLMDLLLHPLGEDVQPRNIGGAPGLEHFLLGRDNAPDMRIGALQFSGPADAIGIRFLGVQPGLASEQGQVLLEKLLVLGARLRALEHDERVAGLHDRAFMDRQLGDYATLEVLNRLLAAIGVDHARRNSASIQVDESAPAPQGRGEQQDEGVAYARRPPNVRPRRSEYHAGGREPVEWLRYAFYGLPHEAPAIGWGWTPRSVGPLGDSERCPCLSWTLGGDSVARALKASSTWSRSPNISIRPSFRKTTLLATASVDGRWPTMMRATPASLRCSIASVRAASPVWSRLAFGSSSTMKRGSPKTARARPMRWRCPPDSRTPRAPIIVS